MKRFWLSIAILGAFVLTGCRLGNKEAAETEQDTTAADTMAVVVDPDTLLLDEEVKAGMVSASMDELFDDFIFGFDQSNRLQRERTRWPLTSVGKDGQRRQIAREEWQHHYVFMGQDFAMVFWSNAAEMDLPSDTTLCNASVEQIYLHSREIHDYHFQRDTLTGKWMLEAVEVHAFEEHELCDFLDFYGKWATDSLFQREHVTTPLRYTMTDDDAGQTVSGTIDVDQWFTFAPMLPRDVITNVRYGQVYAHTPRLIMQMREPGSGMQTTFTFHRQGDTWRLTALEE